MLDIVIQHKSECLEKLRVRKKSAEEERNKILGQGSHDSDDCFYADSCSGKIEQLKQTIQRENDCLAVLRALQNKSDSQNYVALNSVVILENEILVILPKFEWCGACSLQADGKKIICVSPRAPFVKEIWGKQSGDKGIFRDVPYEIISVQ